MQKRSALAAKAAAALAAVTLAVSPGLAPAQASVPRETVAAQADGVQTEARAVQAAPPELDATLVRSYASPDAHQGVAVDKRYFYAVNNRTITKHDRATGKALLRFVGDEDGPIIHMDSATIVGDKLYAATSNYDTSPMTSSVEVFDTRTLRHLSTFSFGVFRGSMTWLDRHDGSWWAGFANYDVVPDGETEPYGQTRNTQVVQLDDRFRVMQAFTIPADVLGRFKPMSNSGGSWGPDGRLWLTGHDLDEAYAMTLPQAGSDLRWLGTVKLPGVEGQAIAWDRSGSHPQLWAIKRSASQVVTLEVPYRQITTPAGVPWKVVDLQH